MKKKRKLNLGKSKIANINNLHTIKGGTMGSDVCATTACTTIADTCKTFENGSTCPTTHTIPASQTCPGGTMGESGTGTQTNNCSANLPSLNC
ncbi:hypothetical protein [uncultured Kordia sp.]|uniref:hypothetical protein n=1 Tax=uncultured Kordia sp. TaxID=507699 RepID=UPI00260C44D3|nr:hypothetical protein [uncultured Kordia sp.]